VRLSIPRRRQPANGVFDSFTTVTGDAMDANAIRRRFLLTQGGSAPLSVAFNAYVATLAPLFELRMNITSGTTITNQGSLGAGQNGTLTLGAGALAQSSPLGAGEAIQWDALVTSLIVPNSAAMDGVVAQTWCFLCKPLGLGEGSAGRFFNYVNSATQNATLTAAQAVTGSIGSTSSALSISSNTIALNTWQWFFMTYDNAGDRMVHLYKGVSAAVNEYAYGTQNAATGTQAVQGGSLYIGNRNVGDNTWDGLISRVMFFNRVLTAPERLQLTALAGV
jgi:hypothetical protein